jgi:chromosome segregation ATPase
MGGSIATDWLSEMIWTSAAIMAVLSTKLVTSLRLKDLKAKFEAIQPHIDELRGKLHVSEDEFEDLKRKEEVTTTRLTHLKGVVQHLENQVKSPKHGAVADERSQVLQATETLEY